MLQIAAVTGRSLSSVNLSTTSAILDFEVYVDGVLFGSGSSDGPNLGVFFSAFTGTPLLPSGQHNWLFHLSPQDSSTITGYFLNLG